MHFVGFSPDISTFYHVSATGLLDDKVTKRQTILLQIQSASPVDAARVYGLDLTT